MKKYVKESINETSSNYNEDLINEYFYKVTSYLREKIYPKLNDDDMYELNLRLKAWFNKNI